MAKAEYVFAALLRRFEAEGRNVSDKASARNYAPTAFAGEQEAKEIRVKKPDLEQAMRDALKAGRIRVESYGRPSRPNSRLVLTGAQSAASQGGNREAKPVLQ
ncbi:MULTISPECIES: hypothetical protein [Bradyrhizobium]